MRNIHLIAAFFLLFALATGALFAQNAKEHDPVSGKDWWVIAFAEPSRQTSHDFIIRNYSSQQAFHYRIFRNGQVVREEILSLLPGEERLVDLLEENGDLIEVTAGNKKKSLYRR
jgi:hypothetical protein